MSENRFKKKCLSCGKTFLVWRYEKTTKKTCSPKCREAIKRKPLQEKFWLQVKKTKTCWLWQGKKLNFGYGYVWSYGHNKQIRAHRLSWELINGSIAKNLCVLHKCDTPACVNPKHLFLGTHADNVQDMRSKGGEAKGDRSGARRFPGRVPKGVKHWNAKLKEKDIKLIRKIFSFKKINYIQLGKMFNVDSTTIGLIIRGKSWEHLL